MLRLASTRARKAHLAHEASGTTAGGATDAIADANSASAGRRRVARRRAAATDWYAGVLGDDRLHLAGGRASVCLDAIEHGAVPLGAEGARALVTLVARVRQQKQVALRRLAEVRQPREQPCDEVALLRLAVELAISVRLRTRARVVLDAAAARGPPAP